MKRIATAIVLCMLLAACGRAEPTPAAPPRTGVANTLPATEAVTHAPATATEEDVAARVPAATRVPAPDSPPGPLPRVVATITLEEEPGACAGSALAVDPDTGYLYSTGVQAHAEERRALSRVCSGVAVGEGWGRGVGHRVGGSVGKY